MKIIVSAKKPEFEGEVDHRFGRCEWLIKIDTESMKWEAFANPGDKQSGGAGIAAAQFVINQKADAVISGDFGPNASQALKAAGIGMWLFSGETSSAAQAARQFNEHSLTEF